MASKAQNPAVDKSSQAENSSTPAFSLWVSDNEDEDSDEELLDFTRRGVGEDPEPPTAKPLLSWKRSESNVNLTKLFCSDRDEARWVTEIKEYDEEEPGIMDDGYDRNLNWTHNFKTFTSSPLPFTGTPGPVISSTDPYTIFTHVWDKKVMSLIAAETNRYAREVAVLQAGKDTPDNYSKVEWKDTTVDELYVFFSLYIYMSLQKVRFQQLLFGINNLKLPFFPEIMNLERFHSLNSYLHFVDNSKVTREKTLGKIKPILDHCNEKFTSMYRPRQYLDIDDSMLLSKDGSAEGIRLHANHIGIRTYELSEVFTGYLLKVHQYCGTDKELNSKRKAEIVMNLVHEYSNRGHRVVTDRYFSSVYLAKLLRANGFDNIGECRKKRKDLPAIIQELEEDDKCSYLYKHKGNRLRMVSRHCGDVSVIAWSEWDLTILSTFHSADMRANKRGIRRPALSLDYYKVKEKISERDQDIAEYIMMSKSNERWYIKMFKRLLNMSIRNSYIIYKYNIGNNYCLNQVKFRHKLAEQLLDNHGVPEHVKKARMMGSEDNSDSDDSWSDIDSDDSNDCSIM